MDLRIVGRVLSEDQTMATAQEIVLEALHNIGQKPLFIPLRTRWFREFEAGTKNVEYRAYGPRWNEKTCRVGRDAVISHGYSGARLMRRVGRFTKLPRHIAPGGAREIYPKAEFIAAIYLPPVHGQ